MTATFTSQRHRAEVDGVGPRPRRSRRCGSASDLDRADPLAVDDHRHVAALDPGRNQCGEPRRRLLLVRGRGGRCRPAGLPTAASRPRPSPRSARDAPAAVARQGRRETSPPAPPAASSATASLTSSRQAPSRPRSRPASTSAPWTIVTLPATRPATTSIRMKATSSCVRTEKPCQIGWRCAVCHTLQSRVMTITLKSLSSFISYCPSLHLASSTS